MGPLVLQIQDTVFVGGILRLKIQLASRPTLGEQCDCIPDFAFETAIGDEALQ